MANLLMGISTRNPLSAKSTFAKNEKSHPKVGLAGNKVGILAMICPTLFGPDPLA